MQGPEERNTTELIISGCWKGEMIQKGCCFDKRFGDRNVGNIHRNMGNMKRCKPEGDNHLEIVTHQAQGRGARVVMLEAAEEHEPRGVAQEEGA